MAIVVSQSFADSLYAGIVERHMQCMQSHMHLAESAPFATTLTLKLLHDDVIVMSGLYYFLF